MDKDYPEITRHISANLRKLRSDISDTMKGFSALAHAAGREGALDRKTKELIALALGVAAPLRRLHRFSRRGPRQTRRDTPGGRGGARHGRLYGRRAVLDVCGGCDRGFRTISGKGRRGRVRRDVNSQRLVIGRRGLRLQRDKIAAAIVVLGRRSGRL